MNWTCEQIEARLSDYLDGLMQPEEQRSFDSHVNTCQRCTALVGGVQQAVISLHTLEEIEPPARLVYEILDRTLGPRDTAKGFAGVLAWIKAIASPKFGYGVLSVAATFIVILSASGFSWKKPKLADLAPSNIYRNADRQAHLVYARGTKFVTDLRVVYEIQSRLQRQDSDLPNGAAPAEKPGSTDGTTPGSPRQQNRANDVNSRMQIMAVEIPWGSMRLAGFFCGGQSR